MNDSLLAPIDVMRFTLAYVAVVILPGVTLATLARPCSSRLERLAISIPCSYGLVALWGLVTALLHLPFDLLTYGVIATIVTTAAGIAWRHRAHRVADTRGRWWLAPFLVAGIQVTAIAAIYASAAVPTGIDAATHTIWTNLIARSHVFPIALMSSRMGANDGSFYPPVFHTVTALVLQAVPMPTYRAVFLSVIATTTVLPLALFCYVRTITGNGRFGGLAALASLAFEPLPLFVIAQSVYPFTTSLLIVPALVLSLRDGLSTGHRGSLALSVLLGIGLFYTHPTEFVTAALLCMAVIPGLIHGSKAWTRAVLRGLCVAGGWLVAALPALAAVGRTMTAGADAEIRTMHDFSRVTHVDFIAVLQGYVYWIYGRDLGYFLLIAVLVGIGASIVRRQNIGLVIVYVLAFAVFVDSYSYNILQRFYVLSFPWALGDRLPAPHYWFDLPLAAIGVDALAKRASRILGKAKRPLWVIVATPILLLGLAVPLGVATQRIATYARVRQVMTQPDLSAVAWLIEHASSGTVVINDGDMSTAPSFDIPIDAGLWLPAIGGPQPLFARLGAGPGSMSEREYLLEHIAVGPLSWRSLTYIKRYHVQYVLYGAGARVGAPRHLDLRRLLAAPWLKLVYSSVALCHGISAHAAYCPRTGSYIFALDGAALTGKTLA